MATALLLATIVTGSTLFLAHLHRSAITSAMGLVERAASISESTINRLFLQVDGTLVSLPRLVGEAAEGGRLGPDAASRVLRNMNVQNLNFRDLLLVHRDGTAWAAAQPASRNRPIAVDPALLADAPRSGGVTITGPVLNSTTGEWALFFARLVQLPGVGPLYAVAEVPVPLVITLLAPSAETKGVRTSVERAGGQLLASLPHDESRIGQPTTPPIDTLSRTGRAFYLADRFRGDPTIAAIRPTLYRTVFVMVAYDEAVALEEWQRERDRVIVIATGASTLVVLLTVALVLALQQRQRAVAERTRSRVMLEGAIESMSDGFVMFDANDRLVVCNSRFKDMYSTSASMIVPGASFQDIIREGARRGQYPQMGPDLEDFVRRTETWHRGNNPPMERLLPDGRWLLITERRMLGGGTVGIRTDITEHKQAMRELSRSERRYRALARAGAVVTWRASADGQVTEAPGWEALTGQPEEALRDGDWLRVIHPEDIDSIQSGWIAAADAAGSVDLEFRVLSRGAWRWVRLRSVPVQEQPEGEAAEWVGTLHDVHDRRAAEQALAESEARFVRAIKAVGMGTWDWDLVSDALHLSPGFEALYGQAPGALPTARAAAKFVHHEDAVAYRRAFATALRRPADAGFDIEFRVAWGNSSLRWLRIQGRAEKDRDGKPVRMSGITQDVTAKRTAELRLVHMARHDALTGLANRVVLRETMDDAVARTTCGDGAAVLCLDLDRFKQVNDTLGHPTGDALLQAVAHRLLSCVRDVDVIARVGGDEFAIVQHGVKQHCDTANLARRIVAELTQPFFIDGHRILIGASIGVALLPQDGTDADQLLRNADLALYLAKAEGRGQYRFFEPEMHTRMQERNALEHDLRRAVAEQEFRVFYQPVLDLRTQEVCGVEALLRWQHPTRGLLFPNSFMGVAEELDLIKAIGSLVLSQACSEAMRWPSDVRVAVNLSPSQFAGGRVLDVVKDALQGSGLRPSRLELEVTETVLLHDDMQTLSTLRSLQELGVTIAMDDFGTGYSSLSYLRKFPFNKVKIDKSFVRDLGVDQGNDAIVQSTLDLCAKLGIRTTAEGVESQQQLEWLAAAGCDEVQGFLFSAARPANKIITTIARLDRTDFTVPADRVSLGPP
jgi:diguanylate cyclase (GGDEF)-like protein/PAS domain S-box-containing protein